MHLMEFFSLMVRGKLHTSSTAWKIKYLLLKSFYCILLSTKSSVESKVDMLGKWGPKYPDACHSVSVGNGHTIKACIDI